MALKLSTTFNEGFTSANAYIMINTIHGDKNTIRFSTKIFYSKTARDTEKPSLDSAHFEMDMPTGTGNDLMVDLYNHLKTLPEFDGSVDV